VAGTTARARTNGNRALRVLRRRAAREMRRVREAEALWTIVLLLMTAVLVAATFAFQSWMPLSAFVIPLVLGALVLPMGRLIALVVTVAVCVAIIVATTEVEVRRWTALAVIALVAVTVLISARQRNRLGITGARGESMLVDLRDRLRAQSELPALPRGWYAEAVMRSAGGASFAGDFIVAAKTLDDTVLEVAVVDVSGKGLDAGTRALLLSGAFGGLLGSLPHERFLPAANAYLLRQQWGEGFATAIHLVLDLRNGDFQVRSAGHPPAVHFHAGSGRWETLNSEGPVLGLIELPEFAESTGRLAAGDALMLYTDGLVETPQRDISLGLDKLLGEAERLVAHGFERGASRLIDRVESANDDRALLLVHRV
jgi:Stage II sporulation protein E (SpoIIE)